MRVLLIASLASLLLACPGDHGEDRSQAGPSKTSTTTANPAAVPENMPKMNPVIPPQSTNPANKPAEASPTVEVQLTEYGINMPATLQHGRMSLHIINSGKENHSFAITGNGVAMQLSQQLTRGDTASLVVDLNPGSYTVYCPVDGHRGKGMERTISVQ